MLEPQPRRGDHLRRLAEIRDDRVVRAVNGEKAEATDCSDQAKRSDRRQGTPIRPPVGYHCVITRSNHGPSLPLDSSSVGLFASARRHRGGRLGMIRIEEVCTDAASRARDGNPETVIRVLRLWHWWDTPRRTRPTRVYRYYAPRLTNPSPFYGPHPAIRCLRDEGDRTRRPYRAADVESSAIRFVLASGGGITPRRTVSGP